MALWENRTEDEILAELIAQLVAQTQLIDLAEGSVMMHVLKTFARELESVELRMRVLRDAMSMLRAVGTDLDERVAELPPSGLSRLSSSPASGETIEVTLLNTAGGTIPAGTVYGRSDDPEIKYIQTQDVVVPAGISTYPQNPPPIGADAFIPVVCTIPGERGNAGEGTIDRLITGPANFIQTVTSKVTIKGRSRETDDELRKRAISYLGSLSRSQTLALEYIAKSFVASDGTRLKHAKAFEDPERPGVTYLVVDDGSGVPGTVFKGVGVSETVPEGDPNYVKTILYHSNPATEPITPSQFLINGNPADSTLYVSVYERGVIYPKVGLLDAGDTYTINNYNVYCGIIAELQGLIEGDKNDPISVSGGGYRASGSRVIVTRPEILFLTSVEASIVVADGQDIETLQDLAKQEIVDYVASLGPGDPLFVAAINQRIMNINGIINVKMQTPSSDVYPGTGRRVIRVVDSVVEVA
jgi:uncharacterized phage protein gp47/JayE